MVKIKHDNRQARRSRKALQQALLDLLAEKSYHKITISDITTRADLARPTFYAHYETKDYLLTSIIDEFLEEFFDLIRNRDPGVLDDERDKEINIALFKIAKERQDILSLMQILDVDALFLKRFHHFWRDFHISRENELDTPVTSDYFDYMTNYLAYSKFSVLKTWVEKNMETDIEKVGNLLFNLAGPPTLRKARKDFHSFKL